MCAYAPLRTLPAAIGLANVVDRANHVVVVYGGMVRRGNCTYYASRFFLPMWAAGFRKKPQHEGYGRKALIGYGIFVGAILVGLAAGGIAELAGGWG
jgi:hypothetical protein